jgi:hypothetical protein
MNNKLVENDFCVYKSGNQVKALGWNINSSLLRNDTPIASYNMQTGGADSKFSKGGGLIENLAVPAGLILLRNVIESNTNITDTINEPQIIGQDLYDRLLELSGEKRKVHKTRSNKKGKKGKKGKTRRKN